MLILTLARFIGTSSSIFRPSSTPIGCPIHVGTASLSYGVALVCFAIAVLYLLKDNVKVEAMAIWSSVFVIGVIASVSKFSVFTEFIYRTGLFVPNTEGGKPFSAPFRFEIPYVGAALAVTGVLLLGVIVSFLLYLYQQNQTAKTVGHLLVKLALVTHIVAIALLVSGIKNTSNVTESLAAQLAARPQQYAAAGRAMAERQQLSAREFAALTPTQSTRWAARISRPTAARCFSALTRIRSSYPALLPALRLRSL